MSEQITKTTEILVPYSLLERALEHYSAAHLNMHDFKRSSGKIFTWNAKTWTCTGGIGQGQKHLQASIREVVPQGRYTGPPHDSQKRGPDFYLGGEFKCKEQVWVMTGNEVTLKPDGSLTPKAEQLNLFP
ncbi:MAG: hypothetical protein L6461_21350 [Anaerolineae bacterium]|nr:hypothetical protein [Anaerolineae bacterium]